MSLVERVKNIILKPGETWPVIASETTSVGDLYRSYIAPLAAIPAVAQFIGLSLIGTSMLGIAIKMGFGKGLTMMVVGFILTLIMVYVLSLIIDALAPSFGAEKNQPQAFKLAAYSATPGWVAGIFQIIPSLGILTLLGALYGIYLLYLGLPTLMKCPKDKAPVYTAAIVGCWVVMTIVSSALITAFSGGPTLRM